MSSFEIDRVNFTAISSNKGIAQLFIGKTAGIDSIKSIKLHPDDPYMFGIYDQLREYFGRQRKKFDIQLDLKGTEFQIRVWKELLKVPYGVTVSYKQLAERIGDVYAVRAIGKANGSNPVPVVVPCHRVIESTGRLGGYSGGRHIKEKLLKLEGSLSLELFEFA